MAKQPYGNVVWGKRSSRASKTPRFKRRGSRSRLRKGLIITGVIASLVATAFGIGKAVKVRRATQWKARNELRKAVDARKLNFAQGVIPNLTAKEFELATRISIAGKDSIPMVKVLYTLSIAKNAREMYKENPFHRMMTPKTYLRGAEPDTAAYFSQLAYKKIMERAYTIFHESPESKQTMESLFKKLQAVKDDLKKLRETYPEKKPRREHEFFWRGR